MRTLALILFAAHVACAAGCDAIADLLIPNTTVTSSAMVSGSCRVKLLAKPVPGSEIRIEVWLPAPEVWNHKFAGTGNGGYSSALSSREMEALVRKGYAVAGSDTGHEGGDLKFAIGHPERIDDWGWRAIHVMTEAAKLVVRSYYGLLPELAYFTGCSTGGHQALSEAQRFPADYDGIVAGDPGNNRVRLNVGFLWSWLAAHPEHGQPLTAAKLPLIQKAGLDAPVCESGDRPDCLTGSQITAVRKIYEGARNPRTGEQIFPGWVRGSEMGWTAYFVGQPEPARLDFWRYWVFHDPNWNPRSFDFDRDVAFAEAQVAVASATSADLSAFAKRGGKLVVYHGAVDPVVPPQDSVDYRERVRKAMGAQTVDSFYRLFIIPGMRHCNSAPDGLSALDRWVTTGVAPDRL